MTGTGRPSTTWGAIAAVALVQSAILGWMVWDRVGLLRSGREVVVDVVPVDPRSLFRGDYVRFGYDFSRVGRDIPATAPKSVNDPVYVLIARTEGDKWRAVQAGPAPIAAADPAQVLLKGRLQRGWVQQPPEGPPFSVRYGIESYFVPEGEGRQLEKMVREKRLSVLLAVGADGTAAIKGILADGKPIHRETSF